jgi:hypothetical protein
VTREEARRRVKAIGWTLKRSSPDEWRVCGKGCNEASAYYTNDLTDAVQTAELEHARSIEQARQITS